MNNKQHIIEQLIEKNYQQSAEKIAKQDDYFSKHATTRNPQHLWIGCADSRVSPEQIFNLGIGEMFVHRGVGNIVDKDDLYLMGCIYFAIYSLNIKSIIICGHYNCALVDLCAKQEAVNEILVDNIKQKVDYIREQHKINFDKINNLEDKGRFLVEKNVEQQVVNFKSLEFIKNKLNEIEVHGLVYDVGSGLVRKIV
ncbi:carbonic anhydrase [Rickettsiales bacterium LUAb2]